MDDMTGGPNELTPEERALLRDLVAEISYREKQDIYKGGALKRIRDERLYRQSHPDDFEAFCLDRWGKRRQTINRYIRAYEVTKEMEAAGLPSPPNVKAADLLSSLGHDLRVGVVNALEDEGGLGKATVKRITEVIASLAPPPTTDVAKRAVSVMVSRNGKVYRSTRVLSLILRLLTALGEGADKIALIEH